MLRRFYRLIGKQLAHLPDVVLRQRFVMLNVFPGNASFTADSFTYLDARSTFFTYGYSTSPGMAMSMQNVGSKYPLAFNDVDGDFLNGSQSYKLHVPKDIPAVLFWSVTVYDPITGSGLDNGQPFPSLNAMDKPVQNADAPPTSISARSLPVKARTGWPRSPAKAGSPSSAYMARRKHSSIRRGS
jgi:hypothetical protein